MIDERHEILKALRATPVILRRLVRDLSDADVHRRPAAAEWAIVEVIAHLGDTDERTIARTRAMLETETPVLEPYDPHALSIERDYLSMSLADALARFEALRGEHLALLESLDDEAWQRTGDHGEHGRITVQQLAAHSAGEDADHLAQIARLVPA